MLRSILAIIFVTLYLIVSIPIMLVLLIVRKFNPVTAEIAMLRVVQWAFKVVLFISGTTVTTKGMENIPTDEAVLFVGNHQSFFDVIISYSQMRSRCGYVAKNNLEHVPLLTWNMRFLHCLFLDRSDLKAGLEMIHKTIDYLKDGVSMFIFPEGTRNKSEDETELLEFHRGSFKAAQRTGCKIIPVSFNNTAACLERHFPSIKKQHVIVEYGKPIAYGDLSKEDQRHIDEYFRNLLTEMVKANQAEV